MDRSKVEAFLADLQSKVKELKLTLDAQAELQAEVATVRSQLGSPKPKGTIIKEGLRSVKRILEGAAGSAAAPLLAKLAALIATAAAMH